MTETNALEDYTTDQTDLVRTVTLSVATVLGDYLEDLVVVGGLVPTLLVPQDTLPEEITAHVGTMDLDLGLDLGILNQQRYAEVSTLLRQSGFSQDNNDKGNPVRQRWRCEKNQTVTVDFLMPPVEGGADPGKLQNLEPDFAAIVTPGLELAFQNRIMVPITGTTIWGEETTREIYVCNPGIFIILKVRANQRRRKPKDAYDLYYLVRNFGQGPKDVTKYLQPLLATDIGKEAFGHLKEEFLKENGTGPVRVAEFLGHIGEEASATKADVVGYVSELVRICG